MIATPPTLTTLRGDLPLRGVAIRAHIVGCTADLALEHTFENTFDETLEVSYVFPLPDLAVVTGCELRIGDRVVTARLEERGIARADYARAIADGKTASLTEQERPDVFTITLGNVLPGQRAVVRFTLAYLLPREDGRCVLRLPLVVAERYVPGTALADEDVGEGVMRDTTEVPDASRVSPPRLVSGSTTPSLAIEVTVEHGELAIAELESNMPVVCESRGPVATRITLASSVRLTRDFVLRFRIGDDVVRSQLAVCPDGDEATFQLVLVPPLARLRTRPRDVVLLLDRSGSMEGWKIVAARRGLARMIDVLDDGDRFAVYAFGSNTVASPELPIDQLVAATAANRARAVDMLSHLTAGGGTEMAQPLELATKLMATAGEDRDAWIVLVTDGQVTNEDALVALVTGGRARILGLGIDDAVGASLLRRLAAASGGRVELVSGQEDLPGALDRLHTLIASPVVEHVTIEADEIVTDTLVPAGPLHLFPGSPMVVRGRCHRSLDRVRVRGRIHGEPFEQVVRGERFDIPALRACWAREHILALEDRFVSAGNVDARAAISNRIIASSLELGVLCRFTAFVAIDDRPRADVRTTRHVQQPVERTLATVATIPTTRWGGEIAGSRNTATSSGTLKGKFRYLSPEMARGLSLEPPHEVFCLAHLLWELVTARRLFDAPSDFETLAALVRAELPPLPPELRFVEPVLRRALAPSPHSRYQTPGLFADALAASCGSGTVADVAAFVGSLDPFELAEQSRWIARAAAARPPSGGYLLLHRIATTRDAETFLAARHGHAPVAYARLREHCAEDDDHVEHFLSHAAIALPGFARVVDAGVDQLGGIFRAAEFVAGLDLQHIVGKLARAKVPMPVPVAIAIIIAAARALDSALDLGSPDGQPIGLLLRDLAPSSLRVRITGEPIWTALGRAPSSQFTVPRRNQVPIATASHLLDPPATSPPIADDSRLVVVPRERRRSWWRS